MSLNPLKVPRWNKTEGKKNLTPMTRWRTAEPDPNAPPPPERPKPRLSRREEIEIEAKKANSVVKIEVRAVSDHRKGSYTLAYTGESLASYLAQVELKMVAIKNAVYDTTNLEHGRLRLTYIPGPGAQIFIGPANYGPMNHLQRGVPDAKPKPGTEDEIVDMRYSRNRVGKPTKESIDSLDVDQI